MELRHFRYFSAVAVYGSFSKAAGCLNLTQPALSRQVKDLEDELGVRLFDRTTRHVAPTIHGAELLDVAKRSLEDLDASIARVSHSRA